MKQVSLANGLFLSKLLFAESQRLRAIARPTVRVNGFVESKHPLGLEGRLLSIAEPVLIIAGLDIVIGQSLDSAVRPFEQGVEALEAGLPELAVALSMALQAFGGLSV